jgi:hypothetical protein
MNNRETAELTAAYIARVQQPSGAIPWFDGGTLDPWDHVESAMGLSIGGYHAQAEAAYDWMAQQQHTQGYWLAAYQDDKVVDGTRAETNFVAYIATGIWHHFLVTGSLPFLERMWPTVEKAMNFVCELQSPHGEVYWALDTRTGINKDALITGCSSIYKSFECALNIAAALNRSADHWLDARTRLGMALRDRPERFDRTWESKERYSMDWFYPILAGIVQGHAARHRLAQRWSEFVDPELGCRCVSDQPWVTIAESCELTMACLAAGELEKAQALFTNLARYQVEDGSWWTGYAFADDVMWPDERPTWTAGAVLLAIDALDQMTGAAGLFTGLEEEVSAESSQHAKRVSRG